MGTDSSRRPQTPTVIDWKEWDRQQRLMYRRTVVDRTRRANIPVPRRASCHYYSVDTDRRNVYFY